MVSRALRTGWTAPRNLLCHTDLAKLAPSPVDKGGRGGGAVRTGLAEGGRWWKFEIRSCGVWIPLDSVAIPTAREPAYKYCFVRYRFFEKGIYM